MIRILALLLAALSATTAMAAPKMVFVDWFTGAKLGPEWLNGAERFQGYPHLETRVGNLEYQQYVPGQVSLAWSRLELNARRMTSAEHTAWVRRIDAPQFSYGAGKPPQYGPLIRALEPVDWVSGQVSTFPNKPFAPGTIFSAKFTMPIGANVWPGAWAFDYDNVTEIDLFEGSGRLATDPMGNFSQGLHDFKSNYHQGCAKKSVPTAGDHIAIADWSNPAEVKFYIDGVLNCTTKVGPRMQKPMALILNLAIGSGSWPWIGVPSAATPAAPVFKIDWVKVERP